jgi:hypothetical protein
MADHHISLTVRSTAGVWTDARFNTSNQAEKILDEGIRHFGLDPTPQAPYVLRRESTGQPIPLGAKIGETGLIDGEVVLIQAGQPIDG